MMAHKGEVMKQPQEGVAPAAELMEILDALKSCIL